MTKVKLNNENTINQKVINGMVKPVTITISDLVDLTGEGLGIGSRNTWKKLLRSKNKKLTKLVYPLLDITGERIIGVVVDADKFKSREDFQKVYNTFIERKRELRKG